MDHLQVKPLPLSFYRGSDVCAIAKSLLGKGLFTRFGPLTGGVIIETEAYAGIDDRASHAFGGKKTERNAAMYGPGGRAYVYFCYGMHYLLNAVTGPLGTPHAVLIRAIRPTHGIETMLERRSKKKIDASLCSGPGCVCQALGITRAHNEHSLNAWPIMICDIGVMAENIVAGPRIGVGYAGKDASLPYRYIAK